MDEDDWFDNQDGTWTNSDGVVYDDYGNFLGFDDDNDLGLTENDDGTWTDSDGAIFDDVGNFLGYEGYTDNPTGYQDLGDGNWYDPTDGSTYLASTGEWVYPDQGFTDPISGATFNNDGSVLFADGSTFMTDGSWVFEDGTKLLPPDANGNSVYIDEDGKHWTNLADAGAPNSWQNEDGTIWNGNDGSVITPGTASGSVTSQAGTQKPPAASGSGGGGSGGGASSGVGGGSSNSAINQLTKTLSDLLKAQAELKTATSSGTATPATLAALQNNLAKAAQTAAAVKNGTDGILDFLKSPTGIMVAVGAAAVLLLATRRSSPAPAPIYYAPPPPPAPALNAN